MTAETIAAPAPSAPLAEFAAAFDEWLSTAEDDVRPLLDVGADFDTRVGAARDLRRLLWEQEWGRYGWPDLVGGRGGTSLHRAVVNEQLFRRGWTGPTVF